MTPRVTLPMRWTHRPPGSNWGDFGPDDQLGRLNLLTPEKVLQGIAGVHDGRSVCLSLPLDYPSGHALNPNRQPPVLRPTLRQGRVNFNLRLADLVEDRSDVLSDDLAVLHLQYSTQWDRLAHVGSLFDADGDGDDVPEPVYYNGFRAQREVHGPRDPADASATGTAPRSTSAAQARGCCAALPLHEHCLFKLGVHLGELWSLTPLARHQRQAGRSRFLLTAPPLRLPGAVGSPVTPVGTT